MSRLIRLNMIGAASRDWRHPTISRSVADILAVSSTQFYNASFGERTVNEDWKIAISARIYKIVLRHTGKPQTD